MENICLNCFSNFEFEQQITLEDCEHTYCIDCAINIITNHNELCPIDGVKVRKLNLRDKFSKCQSKSVHEFYYDIWIRHCGFIQKCLEKFWSNAIEKYIEFTKRFQPILLNCLSNYGENDYDDCIKSLQLAKDSLKTRVKKYSSIYPQLCKYISNDIVWANNECLNNYAHRFCEIYLTFFNLLKDLSSEYYTNDTNKIFSQLTLNNYEILTRKAREISITCISDNKTIYSNIKPYINRCNIEQCLLCLKSIDINLFGQFSNCNHKICCNCIHEKLIYCGCCPFDSNEIAEFKVHQTDSFENHTAISVYEYLISNYNQIKNENFIKLTNDFSKYCKIIICNKRNLLKFFESMSYYYKNNTDTKLKKSADFKRLKFENFEEFSECTYFCLKYTDTARSRLKKFRDDCYYLESLNSITKQLTYILSALYSIVLKGFDNNYLTSILKSNDEIECYISYVEELINICRIPKGEHIDHSEYELVLDFMIEIRKIFVIVYKKFNIVPLTRIQNLNVDKPCQYFLRFESVV